MRDRDLVSVSDDRLGEVSVSLEPLRYAPDTPLHFKRQPLEYEPSGSATITFSVAWIPNDGASDAETRKER